VFTEPVRVYLPDKSYKVFQVSHSAKAKDLIPVVLEKNHMDSTTAEDWVLYEVEDSGGLPCAFFARQYLPNTHPYHPDKRVVKPHENPLAIKLGWGSGGNLSFCLFRKPPPTERPPISFPPTSPSPSASLSPPTPRLQFQHLIQPPQHPPPPELLQKKS